MIAVEAGEAVTVEHGVPKGELYFGPPCHVADAAREGFEHLPGYVGSRCQAPTGLYVLRKGASFLTDGPFRPVRPQ